MQTTGQGIRPRIDNGEETAIIDALTCKYPPIEAVYALRSACAHGMASDSIRKAIDALYAYDFNVFLGIKLHEFLDAANDILGFRKYSGDSAATKNLIATKLTW